MTHYSRYHQRGVAMTRRKLLIALLVLPALPLYVRTALANKSSTSIEAPQTVAKGSEVMIRVTVRHKGNNFLHYTNWLQVVVNRKEIARWDFSWNQRPEAEVFTREVKLTALEDMEIITEANCNIHGSTGPATFKISVQG
jgi:desulfoferrodoxin (superoxide reductase-like protein)